MKKPVTRTLEYLTDRGWLAGRCDRDVARISHDLYGFADIAAVKRTNPGTLYIQCTSASNHAARRKKLQSLREAVLICVASGNQVEVWSWKDNSDEPRREVMRPETWPAVTPQTETTP